MKTHKKLIIAAVIAAIVVAAIFTSIIMVAGGNADVLSVYSKSSFEKVFSACEREGYTEGSGNIFSLSPDGGAVFFREEDTIGIRIDLAPYIDAGLKVEALPETYEVEEGILTFTTKETRDILGFHTAMGHFNYNLGGGSFEWAQDMSANEKDIVFALNPEPLIEAGVNAESVDGWLYDEVEMHSEGKTVKMYLFLKAFNLE